MDASHEAGSPIAREHIVLPGTEGMVNLITALQAQLSLRPIWTQASLMQQALETPQAEVEVQLQKLCYQFKEGMLCSPSLQDIVRLLLLLLLRTLQDAVVANTVHASGW